MKRVTWPTWPELRSATFVIIVFVLIVAAIIGMMDLVFRNVVTGIVNFLAG
jgi:preprotein translocase subunit SecE